MSGCSSLAVFIKVLSVGDHTTKDYRIIYSGISMSMGFMNYACTLLYNRCQSIGYMYIFSVALIAYQHSASGFD